MFVRFLRLVGLVVLLVGCRKPGSLSVETQDLPSASPFASSLDVSPSANGIVVDMENALACDGKWRWYAEYRGDRTHVLVWVEDESRATVRAAGACGVHQRVSVGLPRGSYHVRVQMPPGYVGLERDVVVP